MSDYTQATSFGPKDSLTTGDPLKKIKGTEVDAEFGSIETAIATKANKIGGATDGNIVAMDSDGDIKDSGKSLSEITTSARPPGEITMYGAASAPTGWLLCNGTAVSRTTYSALFAIVGTTYGNGNGTTTFNVPDLRSRMPVGYGDGGASLTNRGLGDTGGAETHTLTISEMPSHNHDINTAKYNEDAGGAGTRYITGSNTVDEAESPADSTFIQNAGGGDAHNNMPPYLGVNFIIKT